MAYSVQYRKRDYLIWTYQRIVRTSSQIAEINSNNNNIIFVVDDVQHAKGLQPLYCNLHRKGKVENVYTHVIVTGRGINGRELIKSNSLLPDCDVPVYDLELQKANENTFISVAKDISNALYQIQPDVLIYINDPKNEAIRGVDTALVAASQNNQPIAKIALPIEDAKHMMWLTELNIEALKIQVITQDRPLSLTRLMRSLNSSIYFGDNVQLTVNMDRSADPVTIKYCQNFKWSFGKMGIRFRVKQGGLITAVVESYYPTTNDDYAVILEDDIEVSPYYYIWLKYTILKYRYGTDRSLVSRLLGISLYGSKLNEINSTTGRRPYEPAEVLENTKFPNQSPYLSQIPCSWGALFFPEIWREFHIYLNARLTDLEGPKLQTVIVPESRSNMWSRSWKRFFIELAYLRGYVMLYPNYNNSISFTTNYAEFGVHFRIKGKQKDLWLLPLMEEDIVLEGLPDGHLPNYEDLPSIDLWGNLMTPQELIRIGRSFHSEISACPPNDSDELTYDPQDLLCE
ncbi:7336_t:CDS:2 [Dentiscutata erythropus]|uniref:7336_t:CDS:1 n=1 Tax=Dentiscutata erythropus TaxID=1348616 RepID=A0A9N9F144_9GLOM|nr:7336_t:CDS:2 [Dentiscutata erythropus]